MNKKDPPSDTADAPNALPLPVKMNRKQRRAAQSVARKVAKVKAKK